MYFYIYMYNLHTVTYIYRNVRIDIEHADNAGDSNILLDSMVGTKRTPQIVPLTGLSLEPSFSGTTRTGDSGDLSGYIQVGKGTN